MPDLYQVVHNNLGFQLSEAQVQAFEQYKALLLEWNARFNLTAIVEPEQIQIKHFLDSLTCLLAMGYPLQARVIDIGSGAGFPGLPLKIACPDIQLTLVESIEKKAEFCRRVATDLRLEGVQIINARAEEVGQMRDQRERSDWALARAVAGLPVLLEYLLPLVRVGGRALAMKGETALAEIQSASRAISLLGGIARDPVPVKLPGIPEVRYLVVVEKKSSTPRSYPRRIGIPAKKPL